MARFSTCLSSFFLLVTILFIQPLEAANYNTRYEPQGKLKVALDFELLQRAHRDASDASRRWIFTSYLQFKESTESITDNQLTSLAVDAWKEMQADFKQYFPNPKNKHLKNLPSVMTIMAFDNKIILASSQRGTHAFYTEFDGNPISEAMNICSMHWNQEHSDDPDLQGKEHMRGGKCGEITAFWLWYQLPEHRNARIGDLKPQARVTTVMDTDGAVQIIPPCGTNAKNDWGCNLLVSLGEPVSYVNEGTKGEAYDLETLAGGVTSISQISSCARESFSR